MAAIFFAAWRHVRRCPDAPFPRAFDRFDEIFRCLVADHGRQQLVETLRALFGIWVGLDLPVKPGQVGQQVTRIMLVKGRDMFTAQEHRRRHPFDRARRQFLFRLHARMDQRRIPRTGEVDIAPPRAINRLAAHPHTRRRRAHIAMAGQRIEEANPRRRIEQRGGVDGLPILPSLKGGAGGGCASLLD